MGIKPFDSIKETPNNCSGWGVGGRHYFGRSVLIPALTSELFWFLKTKQEDAKTQKGRESTTEDNTMYLLFLMLTTQLLGVGGDAPCHCDKLVNLSMIHIS